jgi:hypothetical protein
MYHYMAIPDCDSIEDDKYMDLIYDMVNEDANDWWDEQSAEEFDDDYDAYLGECGYDVEEISEEVYFADCGKE